MKQDKRIIHIVKHLPTGAKIPIIISKINENNIIEEFEEVMDNRKGYTLNMLQTRWDKSKDDVMEILENFEVPGHISNASFTAIKSHQQPLDVAIFFKEYIYGIERKTHISHNKLKPIKIEQLKLH